VKTWQKKDKGGRLANTIVLKLAGVGRGEGTRDE